MVKLENGNIAFDVSGLNTSANLMFYNPSTKECKEIFIKASALVYSIIELPNKAFVISTKNDGIFTFFNTKSINGNNFSKPIFIGPTIIIPDLNVITTLIDHSGNLIIYNPFSNQRVGRIKVYDDTLDVCCSCLCLLNDGRLLCGTGKGKFITQSFEFLKNTAESKPEGIARSLNVGMQL